MKTYDIEFKTLADLAAFIAKEGKIIIGEDGDKWRVIIYDDYIE